jgi:hypothetical protein
MATEAGDFLRSGTMEQSERSKGGDHEAAA